MVKGSKVEKVAVKCISCGADMLSACPKRNNHTCKACQKISDKEWHKKNYIENKDRITEYNSKHYFANKEYYNAENKKRREETKDIRRAYTKAYQNHRYKTDPLHRLQLLIRCRVADAIRRVKTKKFGKSFDLLGCSLQELKEHLEKKFKPGMSWENYGKKGWVVDHILPCASFDLSKEEEQRKCFHYSNLQPLWYLENIKKSDRIIQPITLHTSGITSLHHQGEEQAIQSSSESHPSHPLIEQT